MRLMRLGLAILVLTLAAGCGRKVVTVDVLPKKLKIYGIGNTQRLTARLLDKKGQPIDQGSPTWSSSKEEVASVDSSGRLTAKKEGRTMITARFEKISTQIPIDVIDVKTIEVIPPTLQLIGLPGTQFPLQILAKNSKGSPVETSVQWSSTKPKIATVDSKGVLTSVAPGAATVVARLGDLQSACDVAVIFHDLARLEVRPATAIVRAGETQKFEVVGFGADGKSIEGLSTVFQSSDRSVARVDPSGLATGVATGTATIRATLGNLKSEATLLVN